ncbi:AEC family transporter [Oribacterium sp. WCC10]|uniref:AEC family transporter n=1 Tax=Oribacterium sp. WCC10 TaxID=1855343 RepID=UPI0021018348|nr:AEC family transporter [Oribacterium sp. WCC10]
MTFSNAAFMGFPLIAALYGTEGLLYASSYNTVFNIIMWTYGYTMVSGKTKVKDIIRTLCTTPAIIAVPIGLFIYLTGCHVPEVIKQPISLIGGMNTPIGMIVTGMVIATYLITAFVH